MRVIQLLNVIPAFMESEGSLKCLNKYAFHNRFH
jgi:hypothetical protein